jgi:hypothetical protein
VLQLPASPHDHRVNAIGQNRTPAAIDL